jgi:hypothetical protein
MLAPWLIPDIRGMKRLGSVATFDFGGKIGSLNLSLFVEDQNGPGI